jgi:hypothetical protein
MFRVYRYGSRRQTFVAIFGLFAALNLLSYFYYVSPRLSTGKRFGTSARQQQRLQKTGLSSNEYNEPSFIGKVD